MLLLCRGSQAEQCNLHTHTICSFGECVRDHRHNQHQTAIYSGNSEFITHRHSVNTTCFIQTKARCRYEFLMHFVAVFSLHAILNEYVFLGFLDFWINSVISVRVPGYAYTPEIPASIAPRAIASAPSNRYSFIYRF